MTPSSSPRPTRSAAIPRIGVIGATGAVGTVTLQLLAGRGFDDVRAFASSRSAGKRVAYGNTELEVEEATPETLGAGDLDLCFFSVGTEASQELVPPAAAGGAVCIDKSDAFRLTEGVPLVVAGVNDEVLDGDEIVANPNCSAIQLSCVLKPLSDAAGLAGVRLATYQSMSGAGDAGIERLRATQPMEADLAMDWDLEGDEFSEESKLRAETRKILGLPDVPIQATCVRVPVLVGHSQATWVETVEPLSPAEASELLEAAPHVRLAEFPTPKEAAGQDEVLVARIRQDLTDGRGLALWSVCDNLRKGAALNAVQIAEALLERRLLPA
jgi:aspartate-semialdehyde dehydrogenase